MNIRNLQHNAVGTIDCEIEHPTYGWIPFTASPEDSEEYGRTIYQEAIEGKLGVVAAYIAPVLTLAEVKAIKSNEIREAYSLDSVKPVLHNTINWHGGFESAQKLDSAKRLSESAGLTTVTFYDVTNRAHVLTMEQAQSVIAAVAVDYQTKLAEKQSLMVAIDEATTISDVNLIT